MFGRRKIGVASSAKPMSANPARIPKNISSASCRRNPACTSRSCSFVISDGDFGIALPTRFNVSATFSKLGPSRTGFADGPAISPRRWRMTAAFPGDRAMTPAATSSVTVANAMRGSSSVTLHLDLDHLADPDEADHLHDDRRPEQHVTDLLLEQRL